MGLSLCPLGLSQLFREAGSLHASGLQPPGLGLQICSQGLSLSLQPHRLLLEGLPLGDTTDQDLLGGPRLPGPDHRSPFQFLRRLSFGCIPDQPPHPLFMLSGLCVPLG